MPLHDAASGVPVFVNGFWVRSFGIGGRGTVIEFVGGGDVEVEETPEQVAEYYSRGALP